MLLYCNSDSYGVLSTSENRYSEYLGQLLTANTVINNGIHGHHSEAAHQDFAKFLFNHYNKIP